MTEIQIHDTLTHSARGDGMGRRLSHRWGSALVAAVDTFGTWNERRRQRRALESLPDHLLRDIGVSRLDAEQEADKPFWKG